MVICCVAWTMCLHGQNVQRFPAVSFSATGLPLKRLPFGSFTMIDSRFDTTFLRVENGEYPPAIVDADAGVRANIETYFSSAITQLPHGDKHLLVNLRQYRILNRPFIQRRKAKRQRGPGSLAHDHILMEADLYYQDGSGHCEQIMTVSKRKYVPGDVNQVREGFAVLLNNMLAAVCLRDSAFADQSDKKARKLAAYIKKDSLAYRFVYNAPMVNREFIEARAASRWQRLPILTDRQKENGVFETFEDFRDNLLLPVQIVVSEGPADSVFQCKLLPTSGRKHLPPPYAVAYNGSLYIRVMDDAYLSLTERNGRLLFYVPHAMPDMYAILSYEIELFKIGSAPVAGSNLVIAATSVLATVVMDAASKQHLKNTILKKGLAQNIRYCMIDLDNGDFLYADEDRF